MTTTVIFDVGGVLIDWNPRHLYRKLFDGDSEAMERFLDEVCTTPWNAKQDAGRPFAEAVAELSTQWPEHTELITAFHTRWDEMVLGIFEDVVDIVEDLHVRGTPLYALTNFSNETWPPVRDRYPVFSRFQGIVVSGEEGLVKPDRRIYERLIERYDLDASTCLFIDDSPINVMAATAVGLPSVRFTTADALRSDLQQRGLL